ncbi:9977_t:CDS:10, partial [Diversispora eburnea]
MDLMGLNGTLADLNTTVAPQDNYDVTFDSLFDQLEVLKTNFTKLIWGFDLSGIMKTNSGNTALTDMCVANNDKSCIRNFDTNTNSTILSKLNASNKFAGISIVNLAFDSINNSVLKFIKSGDNGSIEDRHHYLDQPVVAIPPSPLQQNSTSSYHHNILLHYPLMGKNETLASLSSKVDKIEYIKRDTTDVCSSLNFSDVLSDNTKIFGFYDPLKPLENNYPVVEFIKDTRINYLNYIVDINILNSSETDRTIQKELNNLRNNSDLKILFSITSLELNSIDFTTNQNPIRTTAERYNFNGVNIIKKCESLNDILSSIDKMHNSNWNINLITTFTVDVNDKETPSPLN